MSQVAQLSKAAAKLLLRFLETDGATEPAAQAMVEAGVARSDYYKARNELVDLGFIDKRGNLLRFTGRVERRLDDETLLRPPVIGHEEMDESDLPPTPSRAVEPEPQPLHKRAMQADQMDDSGEWNSSNSPRRKRRLAQVQVVQDAWDEIFGGTPLTPENARDFLRWLDDSAEAVLEVFEDCKRRVDTGYVQKPLAWLRSKYENKAKADKAAPQVRQANIGPVRDDGDVMMDDYTPKTKRKAEWVKAYVAQQGDDGWVY